jgi:NAD(P)H-dependent FMN reductase
MLKLLIIIASTRPGRAGLPIGSWFVEYASALGKYDVDLADLGALQLPMLDEPEHPRFQRYQHSHTKAWSAQVDRADAFLIVTPEYNYSMPAPLVNALDYLSKEWKYKPVAFVSYGGVSAGTRAVQMEKQLVTALGMMPIQEAVNIPFFTKLMVEGKLAANEAIVNASETMFSELSRWAEALRPLRQTPA